MAKSPKQIDPFTQKLWSVLQVNAWIQYRSMPVLNGTTQRAHGHDGPAVEMSSRFFMFISSVRKCGTLKHKPLSRMS